MPVPIIQGWLYKYPSGVKKKKNTALFRAPKNKRFFKVLACRPHSQSHHDWALCYFKKSTCTEHQARGWIFLRDITDITSNVEARTIQIVSPARTLVVEALNSAAFHRWFQELRQLTTSEQESQDENPDSDLEHPDHPHSHSHSHHRQASEQMQIEIEQQKQDEPHHEGENRCERLSATKTSLPEKVKTFFDSRDEYCSSSSSDEEDRGDTHSVSSHEEYGSDDFLSPQVHEVPEEVHISEAELSSEEEEELELPSSVAVLSSRYHPGVEADSNWLDEDWD